MMKGYIVEEIKNTTPTTSSQHIGWEEMLQLKKEKEYLELQEMRLSYWRRLLQGRIDIVEYVKTHNEQFSGATVDENHKFSTLVRVLTGSKQFSEGKRLVQKNTTADVVLGDVNLTHTLPEIGVNGELSQLGKVWDEDFLTLNEVERDKYLEKLKSLEADISRIRQESHIKIEEVEGKIVSLYKKNPKLALNLLPHNRTVDVN